MDKLRILRPVMRSTIVFFCTLLSTALGAQSLEHVWASRVGSINDNEKIWRIAVDGFGNVYATGVIRGTFTDQGVTVSSVGSGDIVLLKYDPNGTLLWARSAGGPYFDAAFGIDCDKDGNVYITGAYSGLAVFDSVLVSNIDPDGVNLPFHFVARYSPSGDLVWVRTVDVDIATTTYPFSMAYAIKLDRLGKLVLSGAYANINADTNQTAFSTMRADTARFRTCNFNSYDHIFVQKMDTLGNTEWVHSLGETNGLGVLLSIAFDAGVNIWVGGNLSSGSSLVSGPVNITADPVPYTGLAYKLSPSGQPLDGFVLDCTSEANVEDLIVAGNGELFLAGWNKGSLNGAPAASAIDGFLARTSPSGAPIWTNHLTGIGDDFFAGIATTPEPNEIVGGAFYFYQADFAGTSLATSLGNHSALVRMDTMGMVLEVLQPELISGSTLIADVQSDDFGNFFLAGDISGQSVFGPDTITTGSQDMYVCKISPSLSTALPEPAPTTDPLYVHPNPADDRVFATLPAGMPPQTELLLLDAMGRTVIKERVSSPYVRLDTSSLPNGTYLLTLLGGGERWNARVVVAH